MKDSLEKLIEKTFPTRAKFIYFLFLCLVFKQLLAHPCFGKTIHVERGGSSSAPNSAPGLIEKGQVTIELGFAGYNLEPRASSSNLSLGNTLLRLGVTKRLELRANSAGLLFNSPQVDFDDLGLGFKIALLQEEHEFIPQISFETDFRIPVGTEELRDPGFKHSYLFSFAHDLSRSLSYNAGLGIDFNGSQSTMPYIATLNYQINGKLSAFTDIFGLRNINSELAMPLAQDLGLSYTLNESMVLDISGNWAWNSAAPDFGIDTGISFRL